MKIEPDGVEISCYENDKGTFDICLKAWFMTKDTNGNRTKLTKAAAVTANMIPIAEGEPVPVLVTLDTPSLSASIVRNNKTVEEFHHCNMSWKQHLP